MYAGEQFDSSTGFYYLRARYMNPSNGRFQSMDSFEGNTEDPTSLHKYLYANANPINRIDPSGHFSDSIAGQAITIGLLGTLASIALLPFVITEQFKDLVRDVTDSIPNPRPVPTPSPSPSPSPNPRPSPVPLPTPEDEDNSHRGRIQAQGSDIWFGQRTDLGGGVTGDKDTISWKRHQGFPLSLTDGLIGLKSVENALTKGNITFVMKSTLR